MKNISEMYSGVQKLLKYDGHTIGIPMQQVVKNAYAFNEKLAEKYNIDPPEIENGIWTIDEYYEYAKYVKEASGGEVYMNSFFWIATYLTEYVNPQTGELMDNGENLKKIIQWNRNMTELWGDDVKSKPENNLFDWSKSTSFVLHDEMLIPPPVMNKTGKTPTIYWILCINKYSPNKDLAAQFLEYMITEKHRYDYMSPIMYNAIDKYEAYKMNGIGITDRIRYNSEYLNVIFENSRLEYSVRDTNFHELLYDLSAKYLKDEISLDSMTNEIYSKLKMITGE
jgi:ABC-type glycerol-3-phosphate transport system substrate-binding protein